MDTGALRSTVPSSPGVYAGPDDSADMYQLVELIGSGGEAQVWRAVTRPDPASPAGVAVAVKVFSDDLAPAAAADWLRRAQAMRHVHNPGLAVVHAAFIGAAMHSAGTAVTAGLTDAPCRYLVMELVNGPSLQEWLEDNPGAGLRERLRWLSTLAAGLDALHAGTGGVPPVAHGDVKPDNARLTPDGGVKLVDFGLMRMLGTSRPGPPMASVLYTAPEFFTAGPYATPTPETDRFSFAVTAFQVLTGVMPPLRPDGCGPDPAAMLVALEQSPLTAGRPEVVTTVMAGLTPHPADRPARLVPWLAGARRTTSAALGPSQTGPTAPFPPSAATARIMPAAAALRSQQDGGWGQDRDGGRGRRRGRTARILGAVALLAAVLAVLPWALSRLPGSSDGDRTATPPSQGVASGSTAAAAAQAPAHTTSAGTPLAGSTNPLSGTGPAANSRTSPGTSSNQGGGGPRIARATRRTLAAGEELALGAGLIGTDVTDADLVWEGIPFRDSVYFSGSRRVALVPAVTDQAGCRTALATREDRPVVEPSYFTKGGSACVILRNGRLAQVRVASVDPVSSAAVVEYVLY